MSSVSECQILGSVMLPSETAVSKIVLWVFEKNTYRGGLLWFGYSQHLVCIQRLLQDPLVADGYGNDHDVGQLRLKVGLKGRRQHTYMVNRIV